MLMNDSRAARPLLHAATDCYALSLILRVDPYQSWRAAGAPSPCPCLDRTQRDGLSMLSWRDVSHGGDNVGFAPPIAGPSPAATHRPETRRADRRRHRRRHAE